MCVHLSQIPGRIHLAQPDCEGGETRIGEDRREEKEREEKRTKRNIELGGRYTKTCTMSFTLNGPESGRTFEP